MADGAGDETTGLTEDIELQNVSETLAGQTPNVTTPTETTEDEKKKKEKLWSTFWKILACLLALVVLIIIIVFVTRGSSADDETGAGAAGADGSDLTTMSPTVASLLSDSPTQMPTVLPTDGPTIEPTMEPTTLSPSMDPTTTNPTTIPSMNPTTDSPTQIPTTYPSENPSENPTSAAPTSNPTINPSSKPTSSSPTTNPSKNPTAIPTTNPSANPTSSSPTMNPVTMSPTTSPSKTPTSEPTLEPTLVPSIFPTQAPITQIPTSRRQWKKAFIATLLANFDDIEAYVNSSNMTLNRWGQRVIEVMLNYDTAPKRIRQVFIDVRRVKRGSVIIDCELGINNLDVLDEAFGTINDTVSSGQNISAPGGFSFAAEPIIVLNSTDYPTFEPTLDPTPVPSLEPTIDECATGNVQTLNVGSLADWTVVDTGGDIVIDNGEIRMTGQNNGGNAQNKIYVEQVFDATGWTGVKIGIDAITDSFDNSNEKAFVETDCDGNVQITEFNQGVDATTAYSDCIDVVINNCASLILRVGGYLSGAGDFLYIQSLSLRNLP